MIPYPHQIEAAVEGYHVLKEHMIAYLAMEERTGKTLTSILISEMCKNVNTVLVITKKKAKTDPGGWDDTVCDYSATVDITVTTYHQVHKIKGKFDLVILDEAHSFIAGYPLASKKHAVIKLLTRNVPLIYISATPHAQGYQQLYHQFSLSSWSPWKKYSNFYSWFQTYGTPSSVWIQSKEVPQYTQTETVLCKALVDHLFITRTRKELNFKYEPEDQIHYVELEPLTKEIYNTLLKDRVIEINERELLCDSSAKLRSTLHMLEGGVVKINEPYLDKNNKPKLKSHYIVMDNNEKIDYIKSIWGDTESMVIFYNYIAEKTKLEAKFDHARLLQATSYAEGVDLSMYETVIVYSQDWSTAKHTQRRARQANKNRDTPIIVHFLLVEGAISEQVYETVSINKVNFVDSRFEREEL